MNSHIEVRLFADLARYEPDSAGRYAIRPGITVTELTAKLNIPTEKLRTILIDGVRCDGTATLTGGERIAFVSPLGGG